MRRLLSLAFVFVLSASALAACGGDDDDADATATTTEAPAADTLTKADFIEQGDAICTSLDEQTTAVEQPTDEAGLADYLRAVVDLGQGARDDMAALAAPDDGVEVQQALLDSIDAALEDLQGAIDAADGGDTVTAEDLMSQASEAGDASDEAAQAYGFTVCGKSDLSRKSGASAG